MSPAIHENVLAPGARDQLMSIPGLAALLDVPVQTVYKWRSTGTGPRGIRIGKHVRFRRSDVERWLDAQADTSRG